MKKLWVGTLGLLLALVLSPLARSQRNESNTRTVHGQAIDKGGSPLGKAVVYLKNIKTLQVRTYIADDGGEFHFQGLNSDADYEVRAEHEGASSSTKTINSYDNRKEVHITLKIEKK